MHMQYVLNFFSGELTVTTGGDVTGRVGGSVTVGCSVAGPEPNSVRWVKYKLDGSNPANIIIHNTKYTGGNVPSPALTINSLVMSDAGQYQCTASNSGGSYPSNNKAKVLVCKLNLTTSFCLIFINCLLSVV